MEQLFPESFGSLGGLVENVLAKPDLLEGWLSENGYGDVADRVRKASSPERYTRAVLQALDRYGLIDEAFFAKLSRLNDGQHEKDVALIAGDMGFFLANSSQLDVWSDSGVTGAPEFHLADPDIGSESSSDPRSHPPPVGLRLSEYEAILGASRSVVQMVDAQGRGVATGVLVGPDLVLVTDYVADLYSGDGGGGVAGARVEHSDDNGFVPIVDVVADDPELQLGLFRLAHEVGPPLGLNIGHPQVGERLTLIHYPLGGTLRIAPQTAIVASAVAGTFSFDAPGHPGSGGGAVVDADGRLVGMLHSSRGSISYGPLGLTVDRFLQRHEVVAEFDVVDQRPVRVDAMTEAAFDPDGPDHARPVTVEVDDIEADLSLLDGVTVSSKWGPMVTAIIDRAGFDSLRSSSNVVSIEASRATGEFELFDSKALIRALPVNVSGELGDQALVAVIDNGVDVNHGAFAADGATKILAYWDQTSSARPCDGHSPASTAVAVKLGLQYGRLYLAEDINAIRNGEASGLPAAEACEHGTGVASIAAGAGCDGAGAFPGGVSPGSRLIVVQYELSDNPGYEAGHSDALAFIDGIAERERLPVVVNISNGTNAGGHDGQHPIEQVCKTFSQKPGRVVVKSAGNERNAGRHWHVDVGPVISEVTLQVKDEAGADHVEFWWPTGVDYEVHVFDPSGVDVTGQINLKFASVNLLVPGVPGARILGTLTPRLDSGKQFRCRLELDIVPHNEDARVPNGGWRIRFEPPNPPPRQGQIHGWIDSPRRGTRFAEATTSGTVTIPGTIWEVVCVGAFNTTEPFAMLAESSEGFENFGDLKPDVVAPGQGIRAARGGTGDQVDPVGRVGTSFAAPHVTGAIALALSLAKKRGGRPVPTANEILLALRASTGETFEEWKPRWGHGPVDIAEFLKILDLGP